MTWVFAMIKWRQQYADPYRDEELGQKSEIHCSEDLAVQAYKDDSDINTIVRRFGVTGELPRSSVEPFYGDFSEAVDYQTALNMTIEARQAFDSLPSSVRSRFENDPGKLIGFLQDDSNREEAETLGLVRKAPAPRAEPVPVPAPPVGDEGAAL